MMASTTAPKVLQPVLELGPLPVASPVCWQVWE